MDNDILAGLLREEAGLPPVAVEVELPQVANDTILCGHKTSTGPCTMKKGHEAKFHRHKRQKVFHWKIVDVNGTVLEGVDKVPFLNVLNVALLAGRVTMEAWSD